jgi:hypothetical protein
MRPPQDPPLPTDLTDRRAFLHRLAGVAVGASLAPLRRAAWGGADATTSAGPTPRAARHTRRLDRIGIQVYTVRSLMPGDPEGTLAALAGIGYTEVELAGLYGIEPSAMRQMLDRHGLVAVSGHMSLKDMRRDWPRALDVAATLGQRYIVCSSIDESERSADGFRRAATELNGLAATARQHGLRFAIPTSSRRWTGLCHTRSS